MAGHHGPNYSNTPSPETLMEVITIVDLIEKIGIPACVILAAFWYIRFMSLQAKSEREEMWAKDSSNDERLMSLVESTTSMMSAMKQSVDQNTNTMKELLQEFRFINQHQRGN